MDTVRGGEEDLSRYLSAWPRSRCLDRGLDQEWDFITVKEVSFCYIVRRHRRSLYPNGGKIQKPVFEACSHPFSVWKCLEAPQKMGLLLSLATFFPHRGIKMRDDDFFWNCL